MGRLAKIKIPRWKAFEHLFQLAKDHHKCPIKNLGPFLEAHANNNGFRGITYKERSLYHFKDEPKNPSEPRGKRWYREEHLHLYFRDLVKKTETQKTHTKYVKAIAPHVAAQKIHGHNRVGRSGSKAKKHRSRSVPETTLLKGFPYFHKPIIGLINRTSSSMYILADCADYGSFSTPEEHDRVVKALLALRTQRGPNNKPVEVEIKIHGEIQVISQSSDFWEDWHNSKGNDPLWNDLRNGKDFQYCLQRFCRIHDKAPAECDPRTCTRDQFEKMMQAYHSDVERRLERAGILITKYEELKQPALDFFWMRDEKEVLFLPNRIGIRTKGRATITHNKARSGDYKKIWNHYKTLR